MKKKILGLLMVVGFMSSLGLVSGASNTADVTVNPYISVNFTTTSLDFGSVVGNSGTTLVDKTLNASVDTNADWELNTTTQSDFSSTFALSNVKANIQGDGDASYVDEGYLPAETSTSTLRTGQVTTSSEGVFTHDYKFDLEMPSDVLAGDYQGSFDLTYATQ